MTTSNQSRLICTLTCWGVGLLAGVLALALLMILGDWRFIQGAFVGVLVFLIGGALLSWAFCRPLPGDADASQPGSAAGASAGPAAATATTASATAAAATASATAASASAAAPEATESAPAASQSAPVADTPSGEGQEPTVGASSIVKPSVPLAGQSEIDAGKGSWRYEGGDSAAESGSGDSAATAAAAATATTEEPAEAAATDSTATPDYDQDGILEGADEGTKPEMLAGPRDGGADNLKEIKGIGPKLEQLVNSMGVYHFDQIANWTPDEVAWVNANLTGFKGRVTRDNWIDQAKILADGGTTEFSRRVDKGSVYDE